MYPESSASERARTEEVFEDGSPLPESDPLPGTVPGGGQWAVPHYLSFTQLVNQVSRSYRWTHDEALRHSRYNSLAIRRDPVVMDALRSRQYPTVQLPWHLEGPDSQDEAQAEAIDELTDVIEAIPHFQAYKMTLLEGLFYGRYANQSLLTFDYSKGRRRVLVRDWRPVNGDKLVFKYSGRVGMLVHGGLYRGDWEPTERGRAHFFTPEERETFVIHRHEPEDADFYEGEMSGAVHGVGIRSRIYWFWFLKNQVLGFLMDYLERVGAGGFTVYFYEAGNPESLREVRTAAENQFRNNVVLFPRYKDGNLLGPGIQRVEPSNSGAALLGQLVENYFDNIIRRFILGQSLTSESGGTGLGSGVADLHGDTFIRVVKYDAVNLSQTLTQDLVQVLQKYNHPGTPPLRFVFDIDTPNAAETAEAMRAFYEMGGAVSERHAREVFGLEEPQPGEPILAQMGSLSPATAGAMPGGIPMSGVPGPDPTGTGTGQPMGMPPGQGPAAQQAYYAKHGRLKRRFHRPRIKGRVVYS